MWDVTDDEEKKPDPTQLFVPEDSPADLKRKEAIKGYYQDAWRKKQADSDVKIDSTKSNADMGAYADIAGNLLTNYNNSQKSAIQLPNRLQDLGKKNDTIEPQMDKWNSVAPMFDKQVTEAKQNKEDAYKGFKQDIDLQQVDEDISDKNVARDRNNQSYDPNSQLSKMSQVLAKASLNSKAKEAEAAGDPDAANQLRSIDTSKMSAQEAKSFADSIKNTEYKDVLRSQDENKKIDSNSADRKLTAQMHADSQKQANESRASDHQAKAYTELQNRVDSPRGNKSVQNASEALRNISQAQAILNEYPDRNKMPIQQVNLLTAELAKIASGGVAGEHGTKALEANTYAGNLQSFLSRVGNAPTGAQLGDFIKNNESYLKGLKDVNEGVVSDYKRSAYKGYKGQLSPEQQAQFEQDNPDVIEAKKDGKAVKTIPMVDATGVKASDSTKPSWAK